MNRAFIIALTLGTGSFAGHAHNAAAQGPPASTQSASTQSAPTQSAPNQAAPGTGTPKPSQAPTPPKPQDANPFPEDTNSVPVMPSNGSPALPVGSDSSGSEDSPTYRLPLPSDATDPVRSPDDAAPESNAPEELHSSSSQSGLDKILPSTDDDDQPQGRHRKLAVPPQQHVETSAEDLQVGKYYMESRNWKAAVSRFESALVLAPDEPEVYWGLAEAQRHLGNYAEARSYYLKLLDYDPDGPHRKAARKALKEPEVANAKPLPQPDSNPAK